MKYLVYDKIDELLREKGLSRRKLAMQAGISTSTMSALFARRPVPLPDKYLNPIADALNVDRSVFNNAALNEQLDAESDIESKSIAATQDIYERSLFRQLGNKAERDDRMKRICEPGDDLLNIMRQIINLDGKDIDALESWLAALQAFRLVSKRRH